MTPPPQLPPFRRVLERNATHYGATFQLASALDAAGKGAEARPLWKKMLHMSVAAKDTKTADTARAWLAQRALHVSVAPPRAGGDRALVGYLTS